MEYEVEGATPRGRPKKTWREILEQEAQLLLGWLTILPQS